MQQKSTPKKNSTSGITVMSDWRLKSVKPIDNYVLEVEFMDGLCGRVEMRRRIMSRKAGVFSSLRDVNVFNQVFLEYGVVTWPGEIDLAPDAMHDEIQRNGEWILN